jgi:hypothetical protein
MGFALVIGFIEHLQIVTTSNYSTIANSRTPQFTTAFTKPFRCLSTIVEGVTFQRAIIYIVTILATSKLTNSFPSVMLTAIREAHKPQRSRDSDWLWAGRPRGRNSSPGRVKNFLFSKSSRPALGSTQPPIQWVTADLSPGVQRPGREADHSPPTGAEVNKMWIYTSTPPHAFMM